MRDIFLFILKRLLFFKRAHKEVRHFSFHFQETTFFFFFFWRAGCDDCTRILLCVCDVYMCVCLAVPSVLAAITVSMSQCNPRKLHDQSVLFILWVLMILTSLEILSTALIWVAILLVMSLTLII